MSESGINGPPNPVIGPELVCNLSICFVSDMARKLKIMLALVLVRRSDRTHPEILPKFQFYGA